MERERDEKEREEWGGTEKEGRVGKREEEEREGKGELHHTNPSLLPFRRRWLYLLTDN